MKKAVAIILTLTILLTGLAFNNVLASDPDDMPDVGLPWVIQQD
jgi:hypothetical protein